MVRSRRTKLGPERKREDREDIPGVPILAGGAEGLPARLICGVPLLDGWRTLSLMRIFVPSLISPPEPAPSPSLPEPAFERDFPLAPRMEGAGTPRLGDMGREGGCAGWDEETPLVFLCFLRVDSLPLASERLGEPGRFNEEEGFVEGRGCLEGRPEGVLVPREEAPEGFLEGLDFSRSEAALDSSLRLSSSLRRSVSESSDSLCGGLAGSLN